MKKICRGASLGHEGDFARTPGRFDQGLSADLRPPRGFLERLCPSRFEIFAESRLARPGVSVTSFLLNNNEYGFQQNDYVT